jgi:arylsulfatase A-like enzyme
MKVSRVKELLRKGLMRPKEALRYFYWKTIGHVHTKGLRLLNGRQCDKIHNDLMEEDKFLMIVLDACRTDYFEDEYPAYFQGEKEDVVSSAPHTFGYVSNIWHDNKEVKYISGALPINNRVKNEEKSEGEKRLYGDYEPRQNLDIVDAWREAWDEELGTPDPEKVTEIALENKADKMVVHYFQPHQPFIGETKIEGHTGNPEASGISPGKKLRSKIEKGEVTQKELGTAYRNNLIHVLEHARKLAEEFDDRRVVITSDHGELLESGGYFGHHKEIHHPDLRVIPWLEVENIRNAENP